MIVLALTLEMILELEILHQIDVPKHLNVVNVKDNLTPSRI